MSRKKKKKLKQLEQRQVATNELNGWNCPAVELDDEPDYEPESDAPDEIAVEPMTPPELAFVLDEEAPAVTRHPVIEIDADPVVEPITPDMVAVEPTLARPEAAVASGMPVEPEIIAEAEIIAETEVVTEISAEVVTEIVTETEAIAEAEAVAERARTGQLADYMSKVSSYLSAQPRSEQEIAEDNEKFGGLADDAATVPEDKKNRVLALRNSLAQLQRKSTGRTAGTVVYTTKNGWQGLMTSLRASLGELVDWAFQECYYIGVLLLRYCSDVRRLGFRVWTWLKYTVPPFLAAKRHQLWLMLDNLAESSLEPFHDITGKTRSMRYRLANRAELGENEQRVSAPRIVAGYLYSLGRPINRIANFLLPILGCAVLAATILYFQQVNYALSVEYDGVKLGYVERESDFYEAQKLMYQRLMGEEYISPEDSRPTFKLVIADPSSVMDVDTLTNKIMAISKLDVVTADGIFIDGAFLGAVDDGSEFLLYIDSILAGYRTETDHERVQFVKKVTLQQGIYPKTSLKPVFEIRNALENNDTLPQTYTVADGETLETLADANNTTVDALIKLNPVLQQRIEESKTPVPSLRAGEEILVSKVELSLGIQVTRRETYEESIDYGVDYTDVKNMYESWTSTVKSGIRGEVEIVSDVTYIDGERIGETVLSRTTTKEPVNAQVKRGTLKISQFVSQATGGTNDSFMWPVNGGYVSAGLYSYRGHTGMDIAASLGTGIYAAADGTVSYAVNYTNGAYGRRVDISHPGNIMTRYAHCSEVLVKAGQQVKQGQLIGKIGRTGNASGNHCHFEVRIGGAIMNPQDFVGGSFPGYG